MLRAAWLIAGLAGGLGCGLSWDPPPKPADPLGNGGRAGTGTGGNKTTADTTSAAGPTGPTSTTGDATTGTGGASSSTGGIPVVSVASGGNPGDVCQNDVACDQCITCAIDNDCAQEVAQCQQNQDCADLSDCIDQCIDPTCVSDCIAQHPQGAQDFQAAAQCVVCDTCASQCALITGLFKCQ